MMNIRKLPLLRFFLPTVILLFIAKQIAFHVLDQEIHITQPRRHSVTLQDESFVYHLNFSVFQLEYPILQSYRCSVLIAPQLEQTHDPSMPLLILAVKSHPKSTGRRSALRQTWARETVLEGYRIRPMFLVAHTDVAGHMNLVATESEEYNDILQWDFMEEHYNLSLKERCFLEWLHFNMSNVDYIFKGDDDIFVSPVALVQYIKKHGTPGTLHGAIQRHGVVFRYSKYRVSETLFPNPRYPCFLSGGGFLFPRALVPLLYQASQEIPVFPLDDVYLGFLILAANLSLHDDKHFYVWGLAFDPCRFQRALMVHFNMENTMNMWQQVQEAKCDRDKTTNNQSQHVD